MANDYVDPKSNSTASTNLFNDQFSQFLYKSKWTNPATQKSFIALINSIVLSANDNSSQNMMINYLKKGLDILNVELHKVDMEDNKVVSVSSDDVETTAGGIKTESTQPSLVEDASTKDLKSMMERLKKSLDTKGMPKDKIEQVIRMTFNLGDKTGKGKTLLLDLFDERINQIEEMCGSKQLTEAKETEEENPKVDEQPQPKMSPKHKAPIRAKSIEKTEKPQNKVDGKETAPVILNTFRTFFRNYILEDQMWVDEAGNSYIDYVIGVVNKYDSNPEFQVAYNSKLNSMVNQIGKAVDLDDSTEDSINIKNAKNELQKYAISHKGWNSSNFETFFRNVVILAKSASVSNIQRFILKKLNDINISK